ncbi:helix-turn-helix transcriptional regulator [Vibrio agarivorans]|uniref:AlpA family phage regulatory protein n=1 Tax=Vibrio agarivorans TaxID=153622 RepID=A0ABT7Y0U0_9VIBR|nr:AlpA family phage regulatory protein [Vibrio agarivorans]MDN2481657.1 AlpA family phage regulatory protein [Vibrio agarivorans]
MNTTNPIVSKKDATIICGISIPTIDRLVKRGDFAPKIQLSARRVGFYKQDLYHWLNSRMCHNQSEEA